MQAACLHQVFKLKLLLSIDFDLELVDQRLQCVSAFLGKLSLHRLLFKSQCLQVNCMLLGLHQIVDVTGEVAIVVVIPVGVVADSCLKTVQVSLDALSFASEQLVYVLYVCLTKSPTSYLLGR